MVPNWDLLVLLGCLETKLLLEHFVGVKWSTYWHLDFKVNGIWILSLSCNPFFFYSLLLLLMPNNLMKYYTWKNMAPCQRFYREKLRNSDIRLIVKAVVKAILCPKHFPLLLWVLSFTRKVTGLKWHLHGPICYQEYSYACLYSWRPNKTDEAETGA